MSKLFRIKYKEGSFRPEFASFLASKHPYQVLFGGRGSGKTAHAFYKMFMTSFLAEARNMYYGRHQMRTLRDTTFRDMRNFLKKMPHIAEFFDFSPAYNSPMIFTNRMTGTQIVPFGMDDPETLKGLSEATDVLIDEVDKITLDQFQAVDNVIRTANASYKQLIMCFNPVSETHWLRSLFFAADDPYAPNTERWGDRLFIHHSTAHNNPFMDWREYIDKLMANSMGRQNYINVNVFGLWGVPDNENPWLFAFDELKHVAEDLPIARTLPIHLSFDFNRKPLTCVAFQRSPSFDGVKSFAYFVKEFSGDMQLRDLCAQIKAYFPNKVLTVTGDASGRKGDVGFDDTNSTYYTQIQKFLNLSPRQMHINAKNLSHNDSQNLCNHVLYTHPNFKVSRKGCPGLISDMMMAEVDGNSKTPGALRKDRGAFKMDLLDCFRYAMQTHFRGMLEKKVMY